MSEHKKAIIKYYKNPPIASNAWFLGRPFYMITTLEFYRRFYVNKLAYVVKLLKIQN